jgi:hypothetical protein
MIRAELARHPLTVLRLAGSQAEMGAQQGRLLRAIGGYEGAADFYPVMASRMLTQSLPYAVRPAARELARRLLNQAARRMHLNRRKLFPAYTARTEALLSAGGQSVELAPALLVMEMLQNSVGVLGRLGVVPGTTLAAAAVPACSSLCVWGSASRDGQLRHARNFDFAGAGVWDEAPVVIFCTPDEGLRYGFVATRGADVPGVTAFNEAGLTLTVHTRLHRDVTLNGASVIDLGHEIVRRARNLEEAVQIARSTTVASTWGILVSSAAEQQAILIETSCREVAVVPVMPGADHLSCTNHYLTPSLMLNEVETSRPFVVDTHARRASLEAAVRQHADGLTAEDLELALANLSGPQDGGYAPLAGDCVVSPITVQSIVAEPESRQIRVSSGVAPTSFGPYVTVPWSWDGPVGSEVCAIPASEPRAQTEGGRAITHEEREAVRAYVEVARLALEGAHPRLVSELCEALTKRAPKEPHFAGIAAYSALSEGDLPRALSHLERALESEHGEYRRARLLLQKTRVLTALGRIELAEATRSELLSMTGTMSRPERETAEAERKKPIPKSRLVRSVPDFMLVDVHVPGARV